MYVRIDGHVYRVRENPSQSKEVARLRREVNRMSDMQHLAFYIAILTGAVGFIYYQNTKDVFPY